MSHITIRSSLIVTCISTVGLASFKLETALLITGVTLVDRMSSEYSPDSMVDKFKILESHRVSFSAFLRIAVENFLAASSSSRAPSIKDSEFALITDTGVLNS